MRKETLDSSFKLVSDFSPTGDQPEAISQLVQGVEQNEPVQTLLGVTGSGKTFTVANVINQINRPTLILSHNKTLAAQLYYEFKAFFPENAVEYFVSYYDYYQPEAYLPTTDTYIEKDMAINQEIERLRLSATSALLSGRKDVIVVSSVSCLYGIGNPEDFYANIIAIEVGETIIRREFLLSLVNSLYSRNDLHFERGNFRVKGDTIDIFLAYEDLVLRILFWGDEIESIQTLDPTDLNMVANYTQYVIYPANIFVTSKDKIITALEQMRTDLYQQVDFFNQQGRTEEAKRLNERVNYDMDMIREVGYCSGVENYSRYFDGRDIGSRPYCLIDYFPKDFLLVIDESHVTIPQIRAMYGGDFSRKRNLVEYGFRLPAALDNRPLKFDEFEKLAPQTIYVSATPADYELERSNGVVIEQLIRPTGLLDPQIEVRDSMNQIDNLMEEIQRRIEQGERTLVTTLTKRMAEDLTAYLLKYQIPTAYIHSDVDTLDRVRILDALRAGEFNVLVGVNLLREGLDLPEVSLVAILDADKEGFLRSHRSLTQTVGRAARNINGLAILYADSITESMRKTIEDTHYRRAKQAAYNAAHGITPQQIVKQLRNATTTAFGQTYLPADDVLLKVAEPISKYNSKESIERRIEKIREEMQAAIKSMAFFEASILRDELIQLQGKLKI